MNRRRIEIEAIPPLVLNIFAFLIAAVIALMSTKYHRLVTLLYFAIIFVTPLISVLLHKGQVLIVAVCFILAGAISLLFNDVNPLFRPYERFVLIGLLFLGLGPILISPETNALRYLILKYLLFFYVLIIVVSFVYFLLGLGQSISGFIGISVHPMDLAPVVAIGLIFLVNQFSKVDGYYKWCIVLLIAISFFTLFLTASRGAILAFFVSLLIYSIFSIRKIKNIVLYVLFFSTLFFWFIYANPLNVMDNFDQKFDRIEETEDFTSGRSYKQQNRIMEFKESPIIGVGFSNMTTREINIKGQFEPSNGWLFVLSSTGLLGFIFMAIILLYPFVYGRKYPGMALLLAINAFFIVHTLVEGYTISAGNPLCMLMWMNAALVNQPESFYE